VVKAWNQAQHNERARCPPRVSDMPLKVHDDGRGFPEYATPIMDVQKCVAIYKTKLTCFPKLIFCYYQRAPDSAFNTAVSHDQFYELQKIAKMLIEARDEVENLQSWDLPGTTALHIAISQAPWRGVPSHGLRGQSRKQDAT
jgi:hypothetical protein